MGMLDALMDYDFTELLEARMRPEDLKTLEARLDNPQQYAPEPSQEFLRANYGDCTTEQLWTLCHYQQFAIDLAVGALTEADGRPAISMALLYLLEAHCKTVKLLGRQRP